MSVVYSKANVLYTVIAPGGMRILSAIDRTAASLDCDLVITSACDGLHSGVDDPHHRGEAYDVRSHDFSPEQKDRVLAQMMMYLGWDRFYGFIEDPGGPNEHLHCQVKKGTTYP